MSAETVTGLRAGSTTRAHKWLTATRVGWGLFTLAMIAAAAVILTTMETGLGGDPRLTNPNPGPPPYEPIGGLDSWAPVANVAAAVGSGSLLAIFLALSIRQRRLHWGVIVYLAVMFMGVLDPIANWATFTVFDPGIGHFPLDWFWMRFAPLFEPSFSFLGGYAMYYFTVGLGLYWVHQRFVAPRTKPGTWRDRHPLLAMSLFCFLISLPIDVLMLFGWLRAGIIVFVEGVGPILHWGPSQLPLGMVLYDSWPFLVVPLLCHRDEHGRSYVLTRLARRLPGRRGGARESSARQLTAGALLMIAAGLVPFAAFTALRVTHQFRPSYGEFPHPEERVYDPYGDLKEAGKPGPFYE
jgi:hypothetical protein